MLSCEEMTLVYRGTRKNRFATDEADIIGEVRKEKLENSHA
jgi:hypothetical protein